MAKAVTTGAMIREIIFGELGLKRLRSVAYDLGVFDAHELAQDTLIGRLSRARVFSTDTALFILQAKELQILIKRFGLNSRPKNKGAMTSALQEHFADLKSRNGKLKSKIKPKPKPKIKTKLEIKPKPVEQEAGESRLSDKDSGWTDLDPQEWVKCPLCPSPVKRCNIEKHLNTIHGVFPDKIDQDSRLTRDDIIEAIGREWCVWYMRSILGHNATKDMTDDKVSDSYLGTQSRTLLSTLGRLNRKEREIVADYLDLELEQSDMSAFGRLVKVLYRRSNSETRFLLQEQGLDVGPQEDQKGSTPKPKMILIVESVDARDPQADFVFCPVCRREVTAYHLPQHIARVHPELCEFDVRIKRKGKAPSALFSDSDAKADKTSRKAPSAPKKRKAQNLRPPPGLNKKKKKAWFAAKTAEDYAKGLKSKSKKRKTAYTTKKGKPYIAKPLRVKMVSGGLPSLGKRR